MAIGQFSFNVFFSIEKVVLSKLGFTSLQGSNSSSDIGSNPSVSRFVTHDDVTVCSHVSIRYLFILDFSK